VGTTSARSNADGGEGDLRVFALLALEDEALVLCLYFDQGLDLELDIAKLRSGSAHIGSTHGALRMRD
jgi:hypothetical protein